MTNLLINIVRHSVYSPLFVFLKRKKTPSNCLLLFSFSKCISRFVKEGDKIQQFDKICEVQSDKAAVEISSRFDGVVNKLHYPINSIAKVGRPLIDISIENTHETTQEVDAKLPESDHPSKFGGPISSIPSKKVPPSIDRVSPLQETNPMQVPISTSSLRKEQSILATPAVRRLARENDINLTLVSGTGKESRIMKEDILDYLKTADVTSSNVASHSSLPEMTSDLIELRGFQRIMFKSMTDTLSIPHFGYCDDIHLNSLIRTRHRLNNSLKQHHGDLKLSFMPLFLKAASLALKDHRLLNSHLENPSSEQPKLRVYQAHHIGVAMDTPKGLVVPILRHVEQKSVIEIAEDLLLLQNLGHRGELTSSHLQGGTFTLSNIGVIGGTYASALLVSPQVCIGAIGRIQRLPRFVRQESLDIEESHVMNISWSADHRVIDGASLARFSNSWKALLEYPETWLLELK